MHLDSDDLLARIRAEYPDQFELVRRNAIIEAQAAEIDRLTRENEQLRATPPPTGIARPFTPSYEPLGADREAPHG